MQSRTRRSFLVAPRGRTAFGGSWGTLAAVALATATGSACLSSLPEAAKCEDARAIAYDYCAPAITSGPLPPIAAPSGPPTGGPGGPDAGAPPPNGTGGPPGACAVTNDACLKRQREDCKCTANAECVRNTSTCFPPPDCPASVRAAVSGPQCLEAHVSFASVATPAPQQGPGRGGPSEPVSGVCACGCASCAATCDGRGPVLGGGESMSVEVDALPASGRIGFMVRARGVGIVMATIRGPAGAPLAPPHTINGPGTSFADLVPRGAAGITYAWTEDRARPVAIELAVGANAQLEIDCIVPFLVP